MQNETEETTDSRQRLAYKLAGAADQLGVSKRSVRALMDTGRLGYVRLAGGQRIIPHAELVAYLSNAIKSKRT
jgi:excisionase family DNA binding protein